ncbi:hypothetical protein [Parasitella parasitica]|uniref:Uncharacterized protein n=1 Tax=Parasitella parasitica TaxID=35722 RepID=A0A0B7N479_9FUNG|nr:hypothetical protein [Parasitella parasitica]
MSHIRNNIALRAVNPSLSLKSDNEVNYTLSLNEFQNTLIQQTAARKATREATINKRQHHRFPNGSPNVSNSFPNGLGQKFFWPGLPSQQGAFNSNNNFSRNNKFSDNNNFNNNNKSSNNNNNNNRKSINPFRQ